MGDVFKHPNDSSANVSEFGLPRPAKKFLLKMYQEPAPSMDRKIKIGKIGINTSIIIDFS